MQQCKRNHDAKAKLSGGEAHPGLTQEARSSFNEPLQRIQSDLLREVSNSPKHSQNLQDRAQTTTCTGCETKSQADKINLHQQQQKSAKDCIEIGTHRRSRAGEGGGGGLQQRFDRPIVGLMMNQSDLRVRIIIQPFTASYVQIFTIRSLLQSLLWEHGSAPAEL